MKPNRDPSDTKARPIRAILVLEANLQAVNPDDAAMQLGTLVRSVTRLRPRYFPVVTSCRVAVDEPDPRGMQTATHVIAYLDTTDETARRMIEERRVETVNLPDEEAGQ